MRRHAWFHASLAASLALSLAIVTHAAAGERRQREVRIVRIAPSALAMPTPQAVIEAYAPDPDSPASPPEFWEFTFPAGPRVFESRTDTTIRVARGQALSLSNLAGDISVESWKKDAVRVRAQHSRRDRLIVQVENGVLEIEAVNRMGMPPVVDYDLTVPEWMTLRLSGIESDIHVRGMQAPVEAQCMRGDITVSESHGPLQLSSIEGEVSVAGARDVQATSVNNAVQLERIVGQIDVESVNGDIRLRQVESSNVQASSVSGSVLFLGAFQKHGRYRLASHTGNLQVGVPVGSQVEVSVASFNGAFQSSFPLQVGRQRGGRRFNFTLGTGGSSLELESFQGLIQLLRPAAMPPEQPAKAPKAPKSPKSPRSPHAPQAPQAPPDPADKP